METFNWLLYYSYCDFVMYVNLICFIFKLLSRSCFDVKFGLMQMVAHEEALTILARSIDPRDPSYMLEAVKLMAAICLVPPDGQVYSAFFVKPFF